MKKLFSYVTLLFCAAFACAQSSTPNIGLQIPATGSNNWYIPLNYDFSRIDLLLGGVSPIPALSITNNLTVGGTVTAGGFTGVGGGTFPTINGTIHAGNCAFWATLTTLGDAGAACGSGGNPLSGQTINYIPKATSATASTISSHFFEDPSGFSGTDHGMMMQSSAPNCFLNGVTFIKWGCNNINIFDDGTQDPAFNNGLTGTTWTMQAWGTGGSGSVEGRATILAGDSNNGAMVTPGGKFGWVSNENFFGIGDVLAHKMTHECHGGLAYSSDQGCQLEYKKITDLGFYHATVLTGGTNTQPLLNGTGGCSNPENQSCAPTSGWIMVDGSKLTATGHVTGAPVSGSPVTWVSSSPTDMTLPTPSAWGIALGISIVAGTPWNAPTPQTITIGAGGGASSGSFAAGDLACVIGNLFHEQQTISAVSGSSGAQTITIPLSRPETAVLVVKGQCQYVMSTVNDAHGMTYVLPATSIDGSHLIVSRVGFSGMSPWEGGQTGAEWWTSDNTANAVVNIYAGARILWVGTAQPGFFPFNGNSIRITLEPNTFAVGDALFSPDYPLQKFDGEEVNVNMQMPANSSGGITGKNIRLNGPGMSAQSVGIRISNEQDLSTYTPNGGPLSEPTQIFQSGFWDTMHFGGFTPLNYGFHFANHQPGQTSYTIWSDPTWGTFSINSNSEWHFGNSSVVLDQGSVSTTSGGGFFGYGISAGVGDGGSNGAGAAFTFVPRKSFATPTWLTQCDLTSNNSATDLCVTSQGASRSGAVVTADRSLQVNNLLINGTCTGCSGNAFTGVVTLDGGSSPSAVYGFLRMTTTDSGSGNYTLGTSLFDSAMVSGQHIIGLFQGVTNTPYNSGYFSFLYSGSGSHTNKLTTGFSGFGDVYTIDGDGNSTQIGSLGLNSGKVLTWNSDTGLSRDSAGVVDVGNGTAGDTSGTLKAAHFNTGTNILYRCTTAGTLPVGALTIDTANCTASADTGLRVN